MSLMERKKRHRLEVELGGIEPPSAGRCLSVIRPFPVCGVDGYCVAGSVGPR